MFFALRLNPHVAKLLEVVVQCGDRLNLQIIDHDLARAIRKAPASSGTLLKQNPGAMDLGLRNEVELR